MPRFLYPLLLLLGACGPGPAPSSRLEYYLSADPASLDPARSTDVQSGEVVTLLFDNLVQLDPDGALRPGLATRWEADAAGRRYTFHLRRGATFHDGRPIGATEVRASFLRALAPGTQATRQWPLLPIRGAAEYAAGRSRAVDGIAVTDDSTITFTLAEPLNLFPLFLAMPVAILLARNERWWGGAPKEDSLRIRIIPEALTQGAEYEAGLLSVLEIPYGETRRWEQDFPEQLLRRPAIRDLYVAINTTRGPLADVRVRRALNLAVDVETILKTTWASRGVRAAGAIPPGIVGYDPSRAPYPWDTAGARRLLREAGYGHGFALELWRNRRGELARVAQAVQQDLAAVGVRVTIVERDAPAVRAAVRSGAADLYLGDWYADYPDPENFTYPLFQSANRGPGGNYAFLADSALDAAMARARSTPDTAEKARLSREIDARIFQLAPWIFLWFPVDMWAMRPEVRGWRIPLVVTGQRWTDVRIVR
jgi:ABC-type transport system substrate-binding protein